MPKEIKVSLISKNELRLEEDAKVGDIIRLDSIQNIDTSTIDKLINEGKDNVYKKKIDEELKKQRVLFDKEVEAALEKQKSDLEKEIQKLNNTISGFENEKKLAVNEALKVKDDEIQKLNNTISGFENEKKLAVNDALKVKDDEIQKLNIKISGFENEKKLAVNEAVSKKEELLNQEHKQEIDKRDAEMKALNEEYEKLKFGKQSLNSKEVGEDLEKHCKEIVDNMMQIGFENCTFEKDNVSVKDEGEAKGTKADFLFKVYLDDKKEGEPLTSICLEMKNEHLESENKKKNSDHYAKLDKDRNKKNCKYALLVSNLETDNDNILPIYKVSGYNDMYAVRPAYLTTFLTIITSLTMKFKDVIVADKNQKINLAAQTEFIAEFEKLQNTYLDKPLETLGKELTNIKNANGNIKKAYEAIDKACENIINKYVEEINSKLDKFRNNMVKNYKKINDIIEVEE